jgi:hypothetical protein
MVKLAEIYTNTVALIALSWVVTVEIPFATSVDSISCPCWLKTDW